MSIFPKNKRIFRSITASLLLLVFFISGFPSEPLIQKIVKLIDDRNVVDLLYNSLNNSSVVDRKMSNLLKPKVNTTEAASYNVQTGYYIGNGGAKTISGLGFRPEMIIIKSNTSVITGLIKTSAMPVLNTAYLGSATADNTAGLVVINNDGFSINSTANNANVRYTWIAFSGSDCSATGTFCVGSYTGTGSAKSVPVGFQPNLVMVKQSTAVAANWRSSAMPANAGQYFMATTQNTSGALFTTLDATGFSVGATNSASGGIYYFAAFKSVVGSVNVGTYTGNATDNRNITGVGFSPDFLFLKNANAGTAVSGTFSTNESYGDSSSYFTDVANLVNSIQALQTDGFQVGTDSTANGSGNIIYYAAFGGATDTRNSSGTYKMAEGTYTGTGQYKNINGLGFKPDLVIVKSNSAVVSVFRTSLMSGDSSAYLDSATANVAGAITSIDSDGFTVYNSATTNTLGTTYHWQAFGNAWNPETNSGAGDFYIGSYYGNGIDNRNITRLPFQANMIANKAITAVAGTFRTSSHVGDLSSSYGAVADAANSIQAINSDGFQIGTATNVNTSAASYFYFGFKNGTNFKVGKYTATGVDGLSITDPGFDPDLVWIKRNTAIAGVQRPRTLSGDLTQYFLATAQAAGKIKAFITNGFQLGTGTEVNQSTGVYIYVAWKIPSAVVVGYPAYGELTSAIFDTTGTADGPAYNSIMWRGNLGGPALNQGAIYLQVATSDSPSGPWTYVGPGCVGGAADWFVMDSDLPLEISCYSNHNNKRYFRYKIRICSSDCSNSGEYTPQVNEVMIGWSP